MKIHKCNLISGASVNASERAMPRTWPKCMDLWKESSFFDYPCRARVITKLFFWWIGGKIFQPRCVYLCDRRLFSLIKRESKCVTTGMQYHHHHPFFHPSFILSLAWLWWRRGTLWVTRIFHFSDGLCSRRVFRFVDGEFCLYKSLQWLEIQWFLIELLLNNVRFL